jgi:hypothetical protein
MTGQNMFPLPLANMNITHTGKRGKKSMPSGVQNKALFPKQFLDTAEKIAGSPIAQQYLDLKIVDTQNFDLCQRKFRSFSVV